MTNLSINMTQRTAVGENKDGISIRYVIDIGDNEIIIVGDEEKEDILYYSPSRIVLYRVEIHHPVIMWGSRSDINRDFNRAILSLPELKKYKKLG